MDKVILLSFKYITKLEYTKQSLLFKTLTQFVYTNAKISFRFHLAFSIYWLVNVRKKEYNF
jgi:hypothetical protein